MNTKVSILNHWFLRENSVFENMVKIKLIHSSLRNNSVLIPGYEILVPLHPVFRADSSAKSLAVRVVSQSRIRLWKTMGSICLLPVLSNIWRQNNVFYKALQIISFESSSMHGHCWQISHRASFVMTSNSQHWHGIINQCNDFETFWSFVYWSLVGDCTP